jgi:hypothetical protein
MVISYKITAEAGKCVRNAPERLVLDKDFDDTRVESSGYI